MPSYPRSELEETMQRWLDLNQSCEEQMICASRPDLGTVESVRYRTLHLDR